MNELFDKLNEGQLAAVTATEGYVRIIAGAGSGKTKTLTHRYGYLVKAAGIHPSNVLCVTFTNKAAGEMKKRVRSLIGDGYDNSLITTYHGFCVRPIMTVCRLRHRYKMAVSSGSVPSSALIENS